MRFPVSEDQPDNHWDQMDRLRVPGNPGEITPRWLNRALDLGSEPRGPTVAGFSVEVMAEGTGFINQLFRLRLRYDHPSPDLPSTVIAKFPSADPGLRTVFDRLEQNRREVRFYREMSDGVHLETPRVYHGGLDSGTGNTVLLLEDMGSARQGDSVAGCSLDEARSCLEQLARFQASWWDSPLLDRLSWMPLKEAEAGPYREIYTGAWQALQEKARGGMPPGLRGLGNRLASEVHEIKARLTRPPRTILHGDYRLDNCFFRATPGSRSVAVFDWEFCGRGRGTCDAAAFIAEAFPPQRRREVELDLLRGYHSALVDNGVRGYPFEECWQDYRLSMLEVLVFWIVTGGYCNYEGDRAAMYLCNTLERLDAAISDLASIETVGLS